MAGTANIRAVITADDKASAVVKQFSTNVDKSSDKVVAANQKSGTSFAVLAAATVGVGVAAHKLLGIMSDTLTAANREQAALTGLSSITKAFSIDTEAATRAAEELVSDGLMTIGEAAQGLKNLLAAGFNLDQAITLMKRFKDSAAFGRQASLDFGQAVVTATEGIKNGNSILVDNAGVTKNLSIMLEEAGFSAQDLMRATTDASVRQALYNGIVRETNAQVGDAGRLTELFAGKQAMLSAKTTELKARIGEALQPALLSLLEAVTPIVEKIAKFVEENPKLSATLLIIVTAVTSLIAVLGTLGLAIAGMTPLFTAMSAVGVAAFASLSVAAAGFFAAAGAGYLKVKNEIDELNKVLDKTNQSIKNRDINKFVETYNRIKETQGIEAAHRYRDMQSRATGGPVTGGQPYLVGEEGPELVVPNQSATVIPARQTAGMMGGTTSINVNVGMYAGTQMEKRRMAEELLKALQDLAKSRNLSVAGMMG